MTIRKTAVAVGVAFGISASLLAMIPAGHHSEAAIAVIDQKNIEEAIKTAIQTAKILSTEEKEAGAHNPQLQEDRQCRDRKVCADAGRTAETYL